MLWQEGSASIYNARSQYIRLQCLCYRPNPALLLSNYEVSYLCTAAAYCPLLLVVLAVLAIQRCDKGAHALHATMQCREQGSSGLR
jgi:hypothetical protein